MIIKLMRRKWNIKSSKITRLLRLAIIQLARGIGSALHLPSSTKATARTLLLKLIYPASPASVNAGAFAPANPATGFPEVTPGGHLVSANHPTSFPFRQMRPELSGLRAGLVSVVLPVYNQANLLDESVASVLNQTYQNFELIIINDGSTDGVERILEKYASHPKIIIFCQQNQGLPKALSNGFSLAKGEFFTWTSADNTMEPRQLELLSKKLQDEPNLGMVYADYYAIDDRGDLLQDQSWRSHNRPNPESGEIRLPRICDQLNTVQDNFIGPCFMYRGWIGRLIGDYDPQLGVEDYDYWMRINRLFSIKHLGTDDLLYRYRVHDNTLIGKVRKYNILQKAQALMRYEIRRAKFYRENIIYLVDEGTRIWLGNCGVCSPLLSDWRSYTKLSTQKAVFLITSQSAVDVAKLAGRTAPPVVILFDPYDHTVYKSRQLLAGARAMAVVRDDLTATRIRLISDCPIIDGESVQVATAMDAFVNNRLFFTSTHSPEELKRTSPEPFLNTLSKHILLQVDSFTQGGMENVVIDIARSLLTVGHKITILVLGKQGDAVRKPIEQGIRIDFFYSGLKEQEYEHYLRHNHIELINAHYSIFGASVAEQMGIPFIQTIHSSYVSLDPVTIDAYRKADAFTRLYICVSHAAAIYADIALGLSVSKMRIVPNGVDTDAIDVSCPTAVRQALRKTWGAQDKDPVFLNVASIIPPKAQLPLINAFSLVLDQYPDARLVLLGSVMKQQYFKDIQKRIKQLGIQDKIILAGYDRNVGQYYHAADVFVLPSYWEGWSLSLGEAAYLGLPIVVTRVGSAEYFSDIENVAIIEPPFGDITELNYFNLGRWVYGKNKDFEHSIASAMLVAATMKRIIPDNQFRQSLNKQSAYRTYATLFHKIVKNTRCNRFC